MKTIYLFLSITLVAFSSCAKIDNQEDCRTNILRVLGMESTQDSEMLENTDYLVEYTLNGHNFYHVKNVMDCEMIYAPLDCLGRNLCDEGGVSCSISYTENGTEIGIVGKKAN